VVIAFMSPVNGATVGPVEDISGEGWDPKLNNYLIVEPVDQSGRRWVQAQIASPDWTRTARFGDMRDLPACGTGSTASPPLLHCQ
jgi:hypothetical protein